MTAPCTKRMSENFGVIAAQTWTEIDWTSDRVAAGDPRLQAVDEGTQLCRRDSTARLQDLNTAFR
jgi:hypothetical protein